MPFLAFSHIEIPVLIDSVPDYFSSLDLILVLILDKDISSLKTR